MKIRSKAPLRISLVGGGSDVSPYCDLYGGQVINATIDSYAHCTIIPRYDGKIKFKALDLGKEDEWEVTDKLSIYALPLHEAIYNRIVREFNNGRPLTFEMYTWVDAPPGSGLGSSSALVVAILAAFSEWLKLDLGKYELAHLAYEIERIDLGFSGGKQDQYSAVFGGINHIEFKSNDRVIVNPLRIKNFIYNELESSILLCYTGTSRNSSEVIDDQRNRVKNGNSDSINATHQLVKDVKKMKRAIMDYDLSEMASILFRSWENKKKIAGSITNPKIEAIHNKIIGNGALAGKISGAGNGGFMMFLVNPLDRFFIMDNFKDELRFLKFGLTKEGVQTWML